MPPAGVGSASGGQGPSPLHPGSWDVDAKRGVKPCDLSGLGGAFRGGLAFEVCATNRCLYCFLSASMQASTRWPTCSEARRSSTCSVTFHSGATPRPGEAEVQEQGKGRLRNIARVKPHPRHVGKRRRFRRPSPISERHSSRTSDHTPPPTPPSPRTRCGAWLPSCTIDGWQAVLTKHSRAPGQARGDEVRFVYRICRPRAGGGLAHTSSGRFCGSMTALAMAGMACD